MIKTLINLFCIFIFFSRMIYSQGFDVKASGIQTFSFKDKQQRNQTTFTSITALDEVHGTSNDVNGKVSFDVMNVAATLQGEIYISTGSLMTGISKRDKDLTESKWLDAEKFHVISFTINKVTGVKKLSANKLLLDMTGTFLLHGVKKDIPVEATLTYLDENSITEQREKGDLLGVTAIFQVSLSDFGVDNMILGTRVANNISIGVNIVGTNNF